MADNKTFQSATPATVPAGTIAATKEVSFSGNTTDVQLIEVVAVTGSEGSRTLNEISDASGLKIQDGGNTITVDGTVAVTGVSTAANQSTEITALQAIQTAVEALDNTVSGSELQVDVLTMPTVTVNSHAVTNAGTFAVQESGGALTALQLIDDTVATDGSATPTKGILIAGQDGTNAQTIKTDTSGELQIDVLSSALPSGASTSAKQDTVIGHLDGVETLLGTIDADTGTIAGAVSGTEMQVDIVSAPTLTVNSHAVTNAGTFAVQSTNQTGDNTIGRVKLTDGTDVADILDLTSANPLAVAILDGDGAQITSFGGGTQYTEGGTDASITGTAILWEDTSDTLRAASAAKPFPVEIIAGGGIGGTSAADDADFTAGTTQGTPAQGVYESTPTNVTDGDLGTVGITQGRRLKTSATIDAALPAGTNAIGKLAANSGVDIGDVDILSIAAGDNNIGNVDIASIAAGDNNIGNVDIVTMPNVTNAGTFAVQVDGSALTALQLIDDTVFAEDTAAQAADKGIAVLAVRRDADTSLVGTDNDYANLQVDANGYLKVEVFDGGGSHTVDNAGTFAVQVDGSALTALQLIDNPVLVDDAGFTPATSSVMMAGFEADEGSTDSVDEGDAGAARMTLDRKQIVTVQPHTTGGLSTFMASGSDGSTILVATAQAIKASAGQMYGYYAYNPEAAVTFVHFYNTAAASVTVGTTNPLFTIAIPAGSAANLMGANGIMFSNAGWSCAATTTAGGNTAPATGVSLVVWYM